MNLNLKNGSKLVTEDEIKKSGGIIYNPEAGVDRDAPVNLPNTSSILEAVEQIFEYMCTNEMMKLKEVNRDAYVQQMEIKFSDFSNRYYSLFQLILSGDDISYLFTMLEYMDRVNRGVATFDDVQKQLGDDLKKEFVYTADRADKVAKDSIDVIDDSWIDEDTSNNKKKRKNKKNN